MATQILRPRASSSQLAKGSSSTDLSAPLSKLSTARLSKLTPLPTPPTAPHSTLSTAFLPQLSPIPTPRKVIDKFQVVTTLLVETTFTTQTRLIGIITEVEALVPTTISSIATSSIQTTSVISSAANTPSATSIRTLVVTSSTETTSSTSQSITSLPVNSTTLVLNPTGIIIITFAPPSNNTVTATLTSIDTLLQTDTVTTTIIPTSIATPSPSTSSTPLPSSTSIPAGYLETTPHKFPTALVAILSSLLSLFFLVLAMLYLQHRRSYYSTASSNSPSLAPLSGRESMQYFRGSQSLFLRSDGERPPSTLRRESLVDPITEEMQRAEEDRIRRQKRTGSATFYAPQVRHLVDLLGSKEELRVNVKKPGDGGGRWRGDFY